jgi:hypothetical protein
MTLPKRDRLADALTTVADVELDVLRRAKLVRADLFVWLDLRAVGRRAYQWRVKEPQAAWEALHTAGLIPADALDDPARRFAMSDVEIERRLAERVVASFTGASLTNDDATRTEYARALTQALTDAVEDPVRVTLERDPPWSERRVLKKLPRQPRYKPVLGPQAATPSLRTPRSQLGAPRSPSACVLGRRMSRPRTSGTRFVPYGWVDFCKFRRNPLRALE